MGCSLILWVTVGSYGPLTLVRETSALLGGRICHLARLAAMRRRGVEIGHLVVAVEREDARLRAAGEIRERASFDLDRDHARRLVDGVGPIIGDAALHTELFSS